MSLFVSVPATQPLRAETPMGRSDEIDRRQYVSPSVPASVGVGVIFILHGQAGRPMTSVTMTRSRCKASKSWSCQTRRVNAHLPTSQDKTNTKHTPCTKRVVVNNTKHRPAALTPCIAYSDVVDASTARSAHRNSNKSPERVVSQDKPAIPVHSKHHPPSEAGDDARAPTPQPFAQHAQPVRCLIAHIKK